MVGLVAGRGALLLPASFPLDEALPAMRFDTNFNNVALPGWLERNTLFRKAFLFRKLFLTRLSRRHYAQFGEDIAVARLFPQDHRGFFVDVGCFHPIQHSNTWALYRRGWRGVNIDVDAIKIEGFNLVRPGDTNITCAISDHDGEATFYRHGLYSCVSSIDDSHRGRTGAQAQTVACATLTTVLDRTPFKDRRIDFLSVDAEGHDEKVLQSLDFDRYAPRVVAVETFARSLPDVERTVLYRLLTSRGYALVGWCGLTLIMAGPDFVRGGESPPAAAA